MSSIFTHYTEDVGDCKSVEADAILACGMRGESQCSTTDSKCEQLVCDRSLIGNYGCMPKGLYLLDVNKGRDLLNRVCSTGMDTWKATGSLEENNLNLSYGPQSLIPVFLFLMVVAGLIGYVVFVNFMYYKYGKSPIGLPMILNHLLVV